MPTDKKKALALLFAVTLPFLGLLTGCGKDDKTALPETYQIGEDAAPALRLGEQEGTLEDADTPEEGEVVAYAYTYGGLSDAKALANAYAALLTSEENSFTVVDEEGYQAELPDFSQEEGTVYLAKPSAVEGKLFEVSVAWKEGQCEVAITQPEGEILKAEVVDPMTLPDAVDYIRSLSPVDLGLTGSSMADYNIYPSMGAVFVDGSACLELNIYSKENVSETNDIQGTYLLTGDKKHLYRLDRVAGTVVEIIKKM